MLCLPGPRRWFRPRKAASSLLLTAMAACYASAITAAERTFAERRVPGAQLAYVDGIPLAVYGGTPEAMGRQHAQLMAGPGKQAMEIPRLFAAEYGVDALWPLVVAAGNALVRQAPQRHQQELAAISAAAGEFAHGDLAVANTLLELRRIGCSSVIIEPSRSVTGGPLFGRNFDLPTTGDLHIYSLLSVHRPDGLHAFASVGFPGLVGVFSGMNDAGLALATLDVYESADKSLKFDPSGVPLAFVFRRILEECTTVAEAEALLRSVRATTWMNLAVCDRDGGAVFEITPQRVARRDCEAGIVRSTNHFRSRGLSTGETCDRYDCLAPLDEQASVTLSDVHERLHAANQESMTFQTMIFEPRELTVHLALGEPPSSDDPLTRIELAPLLHGAPAAAAK